MFLLSEGRRGKMPSMNWLEYRSALIAEVFDKREDETVRLIGWVDRKREHKEKIFITLRDGSGHIQLVGNPIICGEETFQNIAKTNMESAVAIEGYTVRDRRAPSGVEVHIVNFMMIAKADPWPITRSALKSPGFLFDMRYLTVRGRRTRATMLIRSEMVNAANEYFRKKGYVWMHAPTFITAASEGGSTLFNVKYFDTTAYLTQSAQLYEEAAICSLEKVYIIQPSFRSEKSRTRRHLTEFLHLEAEVAFANHRDIMRVEEELVHYMVSKTIKNRQKELSALKVKGLEPPKIPFEKITYDEALNILEDKGAHVEWGEDLGTEAEMTLSKEFEEPFFVKSYPVSARSFYHMPDPDDSRTTLSSDMMAPRGYGEITSGGQRIHDYDLLLSRIMDEGLDPEDYKWYLDLRRYGMPPHSGFGLGVERVLRWILDLKHVRDGVMFPRTPSRLYP